jgi:hypothetical protein
MIMLMLTTKDGFNIETLLFGKHLRMTIISLLTIIRTFVLKQRYPKFKAS